MKHHVTPIEIPRKKLSRLLLTILFILATVFVFNRYIINNPEYESRTYSILYGLFYTAAGIFGTVLFGKQYLAKGPGLTLSDEGMVCHIDLPEIGVIAWGDITSIEEKEVKISMINKDKIMVVMVQNPAAYIQRQTHANKQQLMKTHLQQFGSPIIIKPADLSMKYYAIKQLLNEQLNVHKS